MARRLTFDALISSRGEYRVLWTSRLCIGQSPAGGAAIPLPCWPNTATAAAAHSTATANVVRKKWKVMGAGILARVIASSGDERVATVAAAAAAGLAPAGDLPGASLDRAH